MSHPPGTPDPSPGRPEPDEEQNRGADEEREPGSSAAPPTYGSTAYPQGQYGQPPYDQQGHGQQGYPGYPPPPYAQQGYPPAGYGDPYGQPPYGQYGYPGQGFLRPRNGKAIAAMWTGIGALALTLCCGAGVLGLLPIVLGVKARSEIRASGGQQEGDGMALAGIITGAFAVLLSVVVIAAIVIAIARGGVQQSSFGETGV